MKRTFLALCLLLCVGCGPKCLRGHNEPYWVKPWTELRSFHTGETTFFYPVFHEGHWSTRFVCDQLELEKE